MITPKTFLMIAVVLTLEAFACPATQATSIGLLNITGSGPGPHGSSGKLSLFDVAVGKTHTDDFGSLQSGTPVAIASPWIFLNLSTAQPSLWSVGGFMLELNFGNKIEEADKTTINGAATIFAPGVQPVSGVEWRYTSRIGGTFAFRLISGGLVPDSGTTVLLLGVGLVTIAVFRRKFARS